jgi:hypothetical protein
MIGQKEAVVAAVKGNLPSFIPYKNIALVMLTADQLEHIKTAIAVNIQNGLIEYSKDPTNRSEVVPYARSMVMNHLKKAKELNGNSVYGSRSTGPKLAKPSKVLAGIDQSILSADLKEFINTLV